MEEDQPKKPLSILQEIDDELNRNRSENRYDSESKERTEDSSLPFKRPPRNLYNTNNVHKEGGERYANRENHRYATEPSRDILNQTEEIENIQTSENIPSVSNFRTAEPIKNESLTETSANILDSLADLEREIDLDADIVTAKLRDIVNSDLVSIDKIMRIVSDS
ncbi:unnamed protein product [Moneuplotes crassus]|uniref:Uncharacterized protein n=1 Tax=Euplotes crassus TaxID=5936 RepID=A0AAD1Y1Q4_EUPCR|nr:unnamed protein product [Moneuplotes crassus]